MRLIRWLVIGFVLVAATTAAAHAQAGRTARVAAASDPSCSAGTAVSTDRGRICGLSTDGLQEWLGIPYAAAPVGKLRWQPPQLHQPWPGTLAATSYANTCIQQTGAGTAAHLIGSEDCLYLNVWKPAGGARDLPVFVHLHGGGFTLGNSHGGPAGTGYATWPFGANVDNAQLPRAADAIVVTMDYRVGVMGFLADQSFGAHSGDYGLEDQQAALRWVQHNIRAFGGNPANVTIYGESAGASSVCHQIASPTARGLFAKAVSISGEYAPLLNNPVQGQTSLETQDCKAALPTQSRAEAAGQDFAAAAGCTNPATTAQCLRQLPASVAIATAGQGYQLGGHGTIAPTVNGRTLRWSLPQALKSGRVNRVPIIAGVDRDENLIGTVSTAADYLTALRDFYGVHAPQVLAHYPLNRFLSPYLAFRTVAADSTAVCPALATGTALSRWMPTYVYLLEYGDPSAGVQGGSPVNPAGSYHVAGWFVSYTPSSLNPNQKALQDQQTAALTAMADHGTATAPGTPIWPQLKRSHQVMSWQPGGDSHLTSTAEVRAVHQCGFWDSLAP